MNIFKRTLLISFFMLLVFGTECKAGTKYNAFLMGDSIIDNYPHSAKGLAEYLKEDGSFSNVYDYSYEGSKVCTEMKYQTRKVMKKLPYFKGKNNVVIISFGTNDYFKKCGCNTNKLFKTRLMEIKNAFPDAKIIVIIPTHIYKVRNDANIRSIYEYQENTPSIKRMSKCIKTMDYLSTSDIKSDCLHFTSSGYKKTVKQIKKELGI